MTDSKNTNEMLDLVSKVLLRSTVMGFLLIFIWFALYMLAPGLIYSQGKWFGLLPHEIDLIHYCGMAFVKLCVLVFFFFPYIAIRLVLRGNNCERQNGGSTSGG